MSNIMRVIKPIELTREQALDELRGCAGSISYSRSAGSGELSISAAATDDQTLRRASALAKLGGGPVIGLNEVISIEDSPENVVRALMAEKIDVRGSESMLRQRRQSGKR